MNEQPIARRGRMVEDTPVVALTTLFFNQLIAWPIYMTINNFAIERMAAAPWWKRSHFYLGGDGPNFKPENTRDVLISECGDCACCERDFGQRSDGLERGM